MSIENLKFDNNGLIPIVVQEYKTGQVLMLAYANKEALLKTLETNKTHFWSRSREKIWNKGEESGNYQNVKEIYLDCDADTVLIIVEQKGVACHTGNQSCFFTSFENEEKLAPSFNKEGNSNTLEKVFDVIEDRKQNPQNDSYVSGLFNSGLDGILKKVGEEAGETIIAAKNKAKNKLVYELTDLWFHSMVLLSEMNLSYSDIYKELERRFGKSKKDYKLD